MSGSDKTAVEDISSLVGVFLKISSEWGLTLTPFTSSSAGTSQGVFTIKSSEKCASVRIISLFNDQFVIYIKVNGSCRAVNIVSEDLNNSRKLTTKLTSTVFAPIFRPHGEYPCLAQLSSVSLVMISSYLSAIELCQLSQTSKSTNKAAKEDSLWTVLIDKDFAAQSSSSSKSLAMSRSPNKFQYDGPNGSRQVNTQSGSGSPESARSTYRRLHLQRVAEHRRQRQLETRRLYELEQQRVALLQLRADSYPHFEPDLVLPPLRLGMPDSHPQPPFRLPPFGDSHNTWF